MTLVFNRILIFICACIFAGYAQISNATDKKICALFKSEIDTVAYLLDKYGNISKGPIDYGTWVDDGGSEEALIPTKHKLLIFPANTEIVNNDCSNYGCLKLTKRASICKGVASYDVAVRLVFHRKETKYYQYKDDTEFMPIRVTDGDYEGELKYKFSPKLVGVVAKPK